MIKGKNNQFLHISQSLENFIKSEIIDYSYLESKKFSIDLTLGINPLQNDLKILKVLESINLNLGNYPEVNSRTLVKKISEIYKIPYDNIIIGAGSSEILQLILLSFTNQFENILVPKVTFPIFKILSLMTQTNAIFFEMSEDLDYDYDDLAKKINRRVSIIFICHPNNPTGKILNKNNFLELVDLFKQHIFVIDEANADFCNKNFLYESLCRENLIIVRSFSKGFGLASLRVGFAVSSPKIIHLLSRRQTPFTISEFSQKIATIALDDLGFIEKSRNFCHQQRTYLTDNLVRLGFNPIRSDANYILTPVLEKFKSATEFIELLNHNDINVVNGKSFNMRDNFVRISPRTEIINKEFISIVENII